MTPQEDPRRSKTSPRRLQDASKTTPRRFPNGSRYSQDALKTALNLPRHPKLLPRRPRTPQDASKTPPRCLQTSIFGDFWHLSDPKIPVFFTFFYVFQLPLITRSDSALSLTEMTFLENAQKNVHFLNVHMLSFLTILTDFGWFWVVFGPPDFTPFSNVTFHRSYFT